MEIRGFTKEARRNGPPSLFYQSRQMCFTQRNPRAVVQEVVPQFLNSGRKSLMQEGEHAKGAE